MEKEKEEKTQLQQEWHLERELEQAETNRLGETVIGQKEGAILEQSPSLIWKE
jgi:hypothetical protein